MAAERMAQVLKDEGISVWFDRWTLVPGSPWQEAIEDAIGSSSAVLFFIGSSGFGAWASEELRLGLNVRTDPDFRIIPVIGPGASLDQLPSYLRRLSFIDLRKWSPEAIHRIIAAIKGRQPGRAIKAQAPRVFLCHAKEDATRIEDLYFLLKDEGLDPWYDKEKLVLGDHWEDEIYRAIEMSDFFAIFLSIRKYAQQLESTSVAHKE